MNENRSETIITTIRVGNESYDVSPLKVKENTHTYLVIYASGWESPTMEGGSHDAGNTFKEVALARTKINQNNHPDDNCVLVCCPTDIEFFDTINTHENIKRMDIYSHGWLHGLNLGGFRGTRNISGVLLNSNDIDWDTPIPNKGRDLRRVEIHKDWYMGGNESNELVKISSNQFVDDVEVYFWGCNIGGQLSRNGEHVGQNNQDGTIMIEDPKESFAQYFAKQINKGTVYALVGKGYSAGSMFKIDEKGNNFYDDGEMLPANIVLTYLQARKQPSSGLKAIDYMKKFPIE